MTTPDWSDAPEWAYCLAMDKDGSWWWHEEVPEFSAYEDGAWDAPSGRVEPALESPLYSQAVHSLTTRPAE